MSRKKHKAGRRDGKAETATPVRVRKWPARLCRGVTLIAVGLIVAHWFWGRAAEKSLDEQIHAYAVEGEPIYPADLNDEALSDDQNAVIDLREAGKSLNDSAVEWVVFAQINPGPPLSATQMRVIANVMESNRAALKHLDAATAKTGADWQMKFASPVLGVKSEAPTHLLDLATLLRAGALYEHQNEADVEALRRVGQMLALARIVDRQRKMSAHVMAVSIATLAAKTASEIAPGLRLRAPQAVVVRQLIGEFLDDQPLREGQLRALQMARVMYWDTAKEVAGGRTDLLMSGERVVGIGGGRIGCYALKPLIMNDGLWLVRYMSEMLDAAKNSADWPGFLNHAPADPVELVKSPRSHLIANMLLPDLLRYMRGQYRAITECRLAAMALAAGWHAGEHQGVLPGSLEELKPGYLPYVPFDPMAAAGSPLRLGGVAERRVIYSVGDDGVDDKGSEAVLPTRYGAAGGAGPWDRRDFVVRLTVRKAATMPATTP
jgi:hypothetical protein